MISICQNSTRYWSKKIQGIYKIINLNNNKVYIGQSINIDRRFKQHKYDIIRNKKHPLYNSIKCYGIDNFEFIVIEIVDDTFLLDQREQYWLDHYQSYLPENGYNLAIGARGVIHSDKTKKKMANSHKGKKLSVEHRQKIAKSNKGKTNWYWLGKKHTKESILQMSLVKKYKNKYKYNKLQIKGVYFSKKCKKFVATICVNAKQLYLGSFTILGDGDQAYREAEIKYFGNFAREETIKFYN